MSGSGRILAVALGALALLVSSAAYGQAPPPPALRAQVYSPYEQETIDGALKTFGATREPDPEGKIIERIDILPLDVIEQRDPAPRWVNVFHATTRKYVVRREMLLHEGDAYQQVLIDETIRNLRRLPQLSLVLVVPTTGSAPDRVGVIVVTKDIWSLRPNWNFVATSGGLELLQAVPAEINVLGTHQIASGNFILDPASVTIGLGYRIPRIAETRVVLQTNANVIWNRATGAVEGSYGSLVAGQPLYSALTDWSWDSSVVWQDYVARRFVNAHLSEFRDGPSVDCVASPTRCVPFEFRARAYVTTLELTRSFGWDTKHDFTFAASVDRRTYRTDFPGADPQAVADFAAAYVPLSDTRVGPSVQYHTYTKRYLRVIDFDTLALQEDYRLGHDIFLRVYPLAKALGSSRNVLGFYGAAQYSVALRDGLFRLGLESITEPDSDRLADASITPFAHLVSPTFAGFGRFVFDASLLYRFRNYLNQTTFLGGDDRLRGYPTNFFIGENVMAYNLELRTRPLEIFTLQLGAVAFYDVGDAWSGDFGNFTPFQSVGFGLRTLFPQLDRIVFRGDIGFPVERVVDPGTGAVIAPYAFIISLGQAFGAPTVGPLPALPTGQ
jgi:hypothetical protein